MPNHHIKTQWKGKMQFHAHINDHTIIMDAPVRVGGEETGPIPKPLVLAALSGCTGMDVVALLRKSGFTVDEFCLDITGELSKQQPLEYVSIHLVYDCKGNEDVKDALLRAVSDSQEKICGVSHMLKRAMPVTWEIRFNDRELFNNRLSPAVTHLI